MAWSYSGNPLDNPKDQVRFLVGDTDITDPLLQDGEIIYLLNQYGAPLNAAIQATEALLAKFSRMVDESVGSVRISFSQRVKQMIDLRTTLIARLASTDITPYAGGISISDMIQVASNTDRPRPVMTLHEMENQQIAPWVSTGWLWGDQGWGWWW